jgi:GTP-dependent phosphoenolpyruvate carboxykinase
MREVLAVDPESWLEEIPLIEKHFDIICEHLPHEMRDQLEDLQKRLAS